MFKKKFILTLTGYQITWLACVLGEKYYSEPKIGLFVGIIFFFLFFIFVTNKLRFFFIILLIAVPGYLFDSILIYFSIYEFISNLKVGFLPIWMITLWLSFATLFDEILFSLKKYNYLIIFLGGFLGPFTYYSGNFLGIINIFELKYFFMFMIFFWITILSFYYLIIDKLSYSNG